jgi:Putative glutamine amidotransferase
MIEPRQASTNGPEVLFLGQSARGSYAEGALSTWCRLTKVPSSQALAGTEAEQRLGEYVLTVLSDYPLKQLTDTHQQRMTAAVKHDGHGLLMIGGWASFGGPLGTYCGSGIADLLPVLIGPEDDRVNTPLGTLLRPRDEFHPAIQSIQGQEGCVVVGYNHVC